MKKLIVLFVALAALAWGQCGKTALNPYTGQRDCVGGAGIGSYAAVNPQTGTSYAVLTGDRSKLITFTNANPIAVSIAACGSTGFPDGWDTTLLNAPGAGTLTLTPTTSTVEGAATLVLLTTQAVHLWCNGTNYRATWNISNAVIGASALTTPGAIPYVTSAGVLGQDQTAGGQLFWDATNHRLGIGTNAPKSPFQIGTGGGALYFPADIAALVANNAYYSGGWKYSITGAATAFTLNGAAGMELQTAPVGAAGAALTWRTSVAINFSDGAVGLGPANTAPTGTVSILDRTLTTGATLINNCTDGTNVSAVDCRVVTRAGTTQGITNLHEWQNAAGAVLAKIGPTGALTVPSGGTAPTYTKYAVVKIVANGTLVSGTYTSGITATGTVGQTCVVNTFNGGGSGAAVTVALTGTDTIAGGTALVVTNAGTGYGPAITSGTASNGTAVCSGATTVATTLTGSCQTAKGCWSVNSAAVAEPAATAVSQAVPWLAAPVNAVLERAQWKTTTACAGLTAITLSGLGTTASATEFIAAGTYDLKAAVSNTNLLWLSPLTPGLTRAATNWTVTIAGAAENVDDITAGCAFEIQALWAAMP